MSLRSPLDVKDDDDPGPLAQKLPQPKKKTAKPREDVVEPEAQDTEKAATETIEPESDLQPATTPPNGGDQVPPQAGTHVGTSPGTQLVPTVESNQFSQVSAHDDSPMEFSMRAALAEEKDPEQDWVKSGWQAKRYRKAAVKVAIKFKWRGYREEQDVIDAALAAFLPKELMDEAREMARRGEL